MVRVREMQGVFAHISTVKSNDGKRRHPAHCVFAEGKGANRFCTNEQCPVWKSNCRSASKCDFYEERTVKDG